MKKIDIVFFVLTAVAVILLVASFLVPPTGIIDSSVLAGTGEIFAFAALVTVFKAIDNGVEAKITHNDTSIIINDDNKDNDVQK
jgi:hypothetical protein